MEASQSEHFAPENYYHSCLRPLRQWIDRLTINNEQQANLLCQMIPAQCPFQRNIKIGDRTILHIPPLCKLNPVYPEIVALRWRALCYLADKCGADISKYC